MFGFQWSGNELRRTRIWTQQHVDGVYVEISMNPNDQYGLWRFVFSSPTFIFWLLFHFSRGQNWESRSSVFLCSETNTVTLANAGYNLVPSRPRRFRELAWERGCLCSWRLNCLERNMDRARYTHHKNIWKLNSTSYRNIPNTFIWNAC